MHLIRTAALLAALIPVAVATGPVAAQQTFPDYVWSVVLNGDGVALVVMPRAEIGADAGEPDNPFLIACTPSRDWTMYVRDAAPTALSEVILDGGMLSFKILRIGPRGRMDEFPPEYYPSIHQNLMYGSLDFVAVWSAGDGLLETLVEADGLAIEGTGVAMILPTEGYGESVRSFAETCAAIAVGP